MRKIIFIFLFFVANSLVAQTGEGWVEDKKTGCKYFTFPNADKRYIAWTGECANGLVNGQGTLKMYQDGILVWTYVGTVSSGKLTGQGTLTWVDGNWYYGDWNEGKKHGRGRLVVGNRIYEGTFNNDIFDSSTNSIGNNLNNVINAFRALPSPNSNSSSSSSSSSEYSIQSISEDAYVKVVKIEGYPSNAVEIITDDFQCNDTYYSTISYGSTKKEYKGGSGAKDDGGFIEDVRFYADEVRISVYYKYGCQEGKIISTTVKINSGGKWKIYVVPKSKKNSYIDR